MSKQNTENRCEEVIRALYCGMIKYDQDLEVVADYSGGNLTEFFVRPNEADAKTILGRRGKHFSAVQTIVRLIGEKSGRRCSLVTMRPPTKGKAESFTPFRENPNWPRQAIERILSMAVESVFKFEFKIEAQPSDGRCRFVVLLHPAEADEVVEEASKALAVILQAIGMSAGCVLSLDMSKVKPT